MNYSEFYLLENKQSSNPPTEFISFASTSYEVKSGLVVLENTIQVLYKSKKHPTEFLVCGLTYYFHESLLEKFEKSGITGWKTYPVEIIRKGKDKEKLNGYHILTVYGRCGDMDEDRSSVVQKIYPYGKGNELKGVYFENDEWDGNDFFMINNGGYIFITNKVKELLIKENIKYADFIPLTEMTYEGKNLKDKVYEEVENGTYKGDYLSFFDVSRIYYGYKNGPTYLEAMKDEEFKRLWDICNTKENFTNHEIIERYLRRYPDTKEILRGFTSFDSKTQTYNIDTSKRYRNI